MQPWSALEEVDVLSCKGSRRHKCASFATDFHPRPLIRDPSCSTFWEGTRLALLRTIKRSKPKIRIPSKKVRLVLYLVGDVEVWLLPEKRRQREFHGDSTVHIAQNFSDCDPMRGRGESSILCKRYWIPLGNFVTSNWLGLARRARERNKRKDPGEREKVWG